MLLRKRLVFLDPRVFDNISADNQKRGGWVVPKRMNVGKQRNCALDDAFSVWGSLVC